jgi:hypothetical protein
MNTAKVANALNTISVAFGELAEALTEQPSAGTLGERSGSAAAAVPPGSGSPTSLPPSIGELPPSLEYMPDEAYPSEATFAAQPSLADASTEFAAQGSEAVCPAHRKPFVDGRYGPYCQALADDPAWANKKGFCTITPRNVAQYLRVKAAA